ncbi:MAG: pilus assembly protein, partial [Deltaproteobacteria bacterium]|nr:pilus assembly protein [Deltaproteobacteria bacterium]
LPTFGQRTDTIEKLGLVYSRLRAPLGDVHPMLWNQGGAAGQAAGQLNAVNIEVVNPKRSALNGLFAAYGGHLQSQEIDWDDTRDDTVVGANLLSVRVRYYYQLRIPFANSLIHSWTMGARFLGDLRGVQFENQRTAAGTSGWHYLESSGANARGGAYVTMAAFADLLHYYVIPLVATYSMRMQSNLYKDRVRLCAVDA